MPPVVDRAQRDIAEGQLWRARGRLEGFIGSKGYNGEVVELLGDVCFRMGDYPMAGRYWFFTPANSADKQSAIETFVRCHGGRPSQVLSQLPRNLREHRPTRFPVEVRQRLETLRDNVPPRRRKPGRRATQKRHRGGDTITFLFFACMALFFLVCFSLGLRQLINFF